MDFYIVAKALEKLQQVKLKYLLSPIKAKSEPTKKPQMEIKIHSFWSKKDKKLMHTYNALMKGGLEKGPSGTLVRPFIPTTFQGFRPFIG